MRRTRLMCALLVVVTVTLLVGCRSSKSEAGGPTTTSPSSGTTTSAAPRAATGGSDRQRAGDIQVRAADLPSGFRAQPVTTSAARQRQDDEYFDACLHVPTIDTVQTTSSEAVFARSDGFAFVEGLINVTRTTAEAQRDLDALVQPDAWRCAVAAERRFVTPPKGATVAAVTGSRLTEPTGEFGIRTVVTLRLANGRQVDLTSDTIGLVVKRFEVQLQFTGVVQQPQPALERMVTDRVFARARADAA